MPPKARGRQKGPDNGPDISTEEVFDIISLGDTSDSSKSSSVIVTGARRVPRQKTEMASQRPRRETRASANKAQNSDVPAVYRDMVAEALSTENNGPERPLKRRRVGGPEELSSKAIEVEANAEDIDVDLDYLFEDVMPQTGNGQTIDTDSGEDSESGIDDDMWEEVDVASRNKISAAPAEDGGDLHLNLSTVTAPKSTPRRKSRVFSKADRALHLEIHKMHILCLLRYNDRRNRWCNDEEVQDILSPLLNEKVLRQFRTDPEWAQFRRTESIKKGLEMAGRIWETNFKITSRGIRRSYWAQDEQQLRDFKLPADADRALDKADFKTAAKNMEGSRDMGAQLYCAFLRSTGLDVRLVCSLQPLPLQASTKGIPVPRGGISSSVPETPTRDSSEDVEAIDIYGQNSPFSAGGSSTNTPRVPFSSRQRLGHPNAADYRMPSMHTPTPKQSPKPKKKRIIESPYPIFWLEVLDEAHQKWLPVDPLVTHTIAKPHFLEPPANDAENALTYVFAFESDGVVRDVTRRYTKHWAAKILKSRVESTPGGELWLRKALRPYSRGFKSDLDQIEDVELANLEAKEGMPTSIADFKKHPRFVLERDLKRNEVLVRRQEAGKVRAGKKLESVFRRMDVKNVKSAEGWYRLGREVKEGEVPAKIRPRMRRARAESVEGDDGEDGDEPGTPMYTEAQTELYVPPPVVNGRVPRNVYGNLDVYVPSMVPEGGVHVQHPNAAHAARLLGISYVAAVTGFSFRGRHGTAVINGVVIAQEYLEALQAVLSGLEDQVQRELEERRTKEALRMWKRFLVALRVKERIDAYAVEGEDGDERVQEVVEEEMQEVDDNDEGMTSEEYFDDGEGGGFFPE